MEFLISASADLKDVIPAALDETESESVRAATALRSSRIDVLRSTHELWSAWRKAM